ncbi:hypothetical protein GA0074694_0594 [Micromonospora inyonensis]|uniref:Uncharacterized protein n=1 Tax=Micromonospora inyonensis TaxID=47866 RepID=A0A1C6RAA5_9ACTN|nr:hypothetical protein GA0074694_0594 [Micromonospora inyonensis]
MTLLVLLLILLGGPAVMLAPFAIGHALNKPTPRMKETLR